MLASCSCKAGTQQKEQSTAAPLSTTHASDGDHCGPAHAPAYAVACPLHILHPPLGCLQPFLFLSQMVTIVDPHIKRDSAWRLFKEAEDKGLYVKNKEGADFDGWVAGCQLCVRCVCLVERGAREGAVHEEQGRSQLRWVGGWLTLGLHPTHAAGAAGTLPPGCDMCSLLPMPSFELTSA